VISPLLVSINIINKPKPLVITGTPSASRTLSTVCVRDRSIR